MEFGKELIQVSNSVARDGGAAISKSKKMKEKIHLEVYKDISAKC